MRAKQILLRRIVCGGRPPATVCAASNRLAARISTRRIAGQR
jgi:hypothetical protein